MTDAEKAAIRKRRDLAAEAVQRGEMFLLSRAVEDIDALLAEVERLCAEEGIEVWRTAPPLTEVPVVMNVTYEGKGKPRPFRDPFEEES